MQNYGLSPSGKYRLAEANADHLLRLYPQPEKWCEFVVVGGRAAQTSPEEDRAELAACGCAMDDEDWQWLVSHCILFTNYPTKE